MDTHLPGPGGSGEELELPTGQETLTALRDGEGGGDGVGGMGGCWEEGRKWKLLYFNKKNSIVSFMFTLQLLTSKLYSQSLAKEEVSIKNN